MEEKMLDDNISLDFYSQDLKELNLSSFSNIEKVKSLDLSHNRINDLSFLLNFTHLEEIILDSNKLTNSIFSTLPHMSTIRVFSINKNNIVDLDELLAELERKLPNVAFLSMLANPACPDQLSPTLDIDEDDYRRFKLYILYKLPKLRFLNFQSITDLERREATLKGAYLKTIRPEVNATPKTDVKSNCSSPFYKPLGENVKSEERRAGGRYEKCCHQKYRGKNSEGNRFITNKDL